MRRMGGARGRTPTGPAKPIHRRHFFAAPFRQPAGQLPAQERHRQRQGQGEIRRREEGDERQTVEEKEKAEEAKGNWAGSVLGSLGLVFGRLGINCVCVFALLDDFFVAERSGERMMRINKVE